MQHRQSYQVDEKNAAKSPLAIKKQNAQTYPYMYKGGNRENAVSKSITYSLAKE